MILKIRNLILINFIIGSTLVYGQRIFREGFVIKNSGDTLVGLVKFEEGQKVIQKCIFKRFDLAITVVYTPAMINAFGYKQGNYYERKELDGKTLFLECIIKGKISLFAEGKKLYIEENKRLIELKDNETKVIINNEEKVFANYKQLLDYIVLNAGGTSISKNLKFNDKAIASIIIECNKLMNNRFIAYNRGVNKKMFDEATMLLGVNMRSYGLLNVIKQSSIVLNSEVPITSQIDYKQKGRVWSFGLFYNKQISRMNKSLLWQIELLFSRSSSYFYKEFTRSFPSETQRLDFLFYQSTIRVPFKIQYEVSLNKFTPFFNAGLSYNYNIINTKHGSLETENVSNTVYTYGIYDLENGGKFGTISPFIGCGLKHRLGSDRFVVFELRAEIEKGEYPSIMFAWNNSARFNLKNDQPQFSFLFGIGF